MPSNSAHVMEIDIVADGPYFSSPMLTGGATFISANKPLELVKALEALAVSARLVYDVAMAEYERSKNDA